MSIEDEMGEDVHNNTLGGLLQKLEDGRAINEFGADVQDYLRDLRRAAKKKNGRVVGKVTIELTIPMSAQGYMHVTGSLKTKQIPKPARPESVIYTDEDGDINGLPVPKQTTIFEVKNGKNTNTKDVAAPAAKSM